MSLRAKDIAEILGVSTATVSLVLNNRPGVSEQKRQEILEKIKELDCEHLLREMPVYGGTIGFVVYKTVEKIIDESPFFAYILEGINGALHEHRYNLTFIYMNRRTKEETQKKQLQTSDCKGFIIFGVEMDREDLQVFIDTGLPFVVLDNSFQDSDVDSVAINNSQGVSKAMQYAYDMGHREIGYIKCKERITSFDERFRAYKRWLRYLGLPFQENYVCEVNYSEIDVRREVKKYLENEKEVPTIFLAENDFIACNAMQGMQELGYQIPEQISIIGFDDRPICQMMRPTVTTVSISKAAFGRTAVELLMDKMMSQRNYSMKTEIGTKLLVRSSVKKIFRQNIPTM